MNARSVNGIEENASPSDDYTPEQIVGYFKDFYAAFEGLHEGVAERIPKYSDIANYTSEMQDAVKNVTNFYG